ncbi:MAG: type II secretion system F family protein [Deltaproteobacteria bacterium]|nr:type II secretion system F family protein [Deltaproteobacteria bacterium]
MAISISRVKTLSGEQSRNAASDTIPAKWEELIGHLRKPVSSGELIFFTSQLSLMMEVGTSLAVALRATAEQNKNPRFKTIIESMLRDVEEGHQLSDAMSRHPRVFNNVFISMVKAGESGGFLKKTLDGITAMQEKRKALVTQLRTTLTYPVILCIMAIAVVIFVLVGILPKFAVLFAGKERVLPLSTRFLMAASSFLQNYWWLLVVVLFGALIALKAFLKSHRGKELTDRLILTMPVIGPVANKIYTSQLLRTLGNLMDSQVPLLQALKATHSTFSNRHFSRFIEELQDHVEQGGRLSLPFAKNPYIMESVKQMVATGEEVGNLSRVMLRLADFYDIEVDRELKIVGSLIEPLALIMMGIVVGLIVSSVILPIFRIASAVH